MRAAFKDIPAEQQYDELDQFDRDNRYIDEHYEELWKRYPNCWIAVYREQFVMFARDIDELIKRLEYNRIPPEKVARRKLLTKENPAKPDLIL